MRIISFIFLCSNNISIVLQALSVNKIIKKTDIIHPRKIEPLWLKNKTFDGVIYQNIVIYTSQTIHVIDFFFATLTCFHTKRIFSLCTFLLLDLSKTFYFCFIFSNDQNNFDPKMYIINVNIFLVL